MKKLLLTFIVFWSCSSPVEKPQIEKIKVVDYQPPLQVLTIDSCQYLYGPWANATVLTHKGNCNNPIHKK